MTVRWRWGGGGKAASSVILIYRRWAQPHGPRGRHDDKVFARYCDHAWRRGPERSFRLRVSARRTSYVRVWTCRGADGAEGWDGPAVMRGPKLAGRSGLVPHRADGGAQNDDALPGSKPSSRAAGFRGSQLLTLRREKPVSYAISSIFLRMLLMELDA